MRYDLHLKGYVGGWDFDADHVDWLMSQYDGQPLNVLIDSTGGSARAGFAIQHAFSRHGNVTARLIGFCASAATIAAMGARRVEIESTAFFLVHKGAISAQSLAEPIKADEIENLIEDLKKTKQHLDDLDMVVAKLYASRCKKSPEELIALMSEDRWLTADEAKEWGFVDDVIQSTEVCALSPVEVVAIAEGKLPALPEKAAQCETSGQQQRAQQSTENAEGNEANEPSLSMIERICDKISCIFSRSRSGRDPEQTEAGTADEVSADVSVVSESEPVQVDNVSPEPDDKITVPVMTQNVPKSESKVADPWCEAHAKALDLYKSLP